MLRLAGEIADGVMLWLCNPEYIRRVVVPEVTAGRASAPARGWRDSTSWPRSRGGHRRSRGRLRDHARGPHHLLEPPVLPRDDRAFGLRGRDRGVRRRHEGRRPRQGQEGISDDFLDALTAIGTPDEVRAGVARYRDAGATSPCVGPVPRTDFAATLKQPLPPMTADCQLRTTNCDRISLAFAPLRYVELRHGWRDDSQHSVKPSKASGRRNPKDTRYTASACRPFLADRIYLEAIDRRGLGR